MSTVVNKVLETRDYSMFRSLNGNRRINEIHLRRIVKSMKERYLFSPILVNEKIEIIDGQHRYRAISELGLPLYYIVMENYGLEEIKRLNTNMKNWRKEDYLNAYCDEGDVEYIKFRDFMNKYPSFGVSACEVMLTDGTNRRAIINGTNTTTRYFENGELHIPDFEYALECAEKISMIKPHYTGYNRRSFVRSMVSIFQIEDYDHDIFLRKLKIKSDNLKQCGTIRQYRLAIENIYNFKSRSVNKVSLRLF